MIYNSVADIYAANEGVRRRLLARVEGLDDAGLQSAVEQAHAGCPFSQLLERAGATVTVTARLA